MDCGGDGLPLGTHYYHTDRESSLLSLNTTPQDVSPKANVASLLIVQLSSLHGLAFFYQLYATTSSYRSRGLMVGRAAISRAIAGSILALGSRLSALGSRLSAIGYR